MSHSRTQVETLTAGEIEAVRAYAGRHGMKPTERKLGVSVETLRKVMAGAEPVGKQTARSVRLLCEAEGVAG